MKVLLDTSVLVAAVIDDHPDHERAFATLEKVQDRKFEGFVSAHTLAELYAILTRLPPPNRHSPEQALLSIEENVIKHFQLSALAGTDYAMLLREAATNGILGGTIYDLVHVKSAANAQVARIYTLNTKHFQALVSSTSSLSVIAP